jgi:hypothetical protein
MNKDGFFITQLEKNVIQKFAEDMEVMLMFGDKHNIRKVALNAIHEACSKGEINIKQWKRLVRLCDKGELDNIRFAERLLKVWVDGDV